MTLRFLVAALLCVGIAGATAFQNGSFSCNGDPNSVPSTCGFAVPAGQYWQYLGPGSTAIAGWTVGSAGINWVYEYNRPGYGWETTVSGDGAHYSVGLQGYGASGYETGTIFQTFDTVNGQKYTLNYLYSMAPAAALSKTFVQASVRAEGLPTQVITYTLADHPTYSTASIGSNMAWVLGSYSWTAVGSTTTISFQSLETGTGNSVNINGGIALDGLHFQRDDVPEPATMSMMFGAGLFGLAWFVRRKRS